MKAIQGNFPNIRVQGCFFHFCQAVLRQVGRLGLRTNYIHNQEITKKVFLLVNLVPAGFEILNVGTSGPVEALFDGSGLQPLKFRFEMFMVWLCEPTTIWNCLQLIIDEQAKTVTVVRQMDDGYTRGRGSVRRSAAYGDQQRRVTALIGRLRHMPYDKKGCKGELSTNLDATAVLRQTSHSNTCPVDEHIAYQMENKAMLKKRSAEEAKTIPQIYDEEAAAASAEPSTSCQFPFFRKGKSAMYKQRANRFSRLPTYKHHQDLLLAPEFTRTKSGKAFPSMLFIIHAIRCYLLLILLLLSIEK
ncbi:hypothetical protein T4A_9277 [Trichinella pseudospiralis]|uniref:MULE transposase domain-containing protein n=1 Tax=Trichinella pseudospiralis TaxID=6337 RepID=A0A0V1EK59_TRIPS|nr:hypothetical protein T4A_9277 [Trichinella pseudospiralis]